MSDKTPKEKIRELRIFFNTMPIILEPNILELMYTALEMQKHLEDTPGNYIVQVV